MNRGQYTKIVLVGIAALLVIILVYQGFNDSDKTFTGELGPTPAGQDSSDQSNWEYNVNELVKNLTTSDTVPPKLKAHYEVETRDSSWKRQAAALWDSAGHNLIAGYYYELLAEENGKANTWYKAGERFFNLQNRVRDSFVRNQIVQHSINALSKTVELDPTNLKAKAELGVCYLESSYGTPMQGIGLLKEVEQVDSNNQEALFYLGYFSIQTGQYDKAIARFNKLRSLYPETAIYHQYAGRAYLLNGEKEEAISCYEQHVTLLSDGQAKDDAIARLNDLKNS